ncbi:MAG: carboxypeptidase regulatory-like domain-containing protein [Marinifilaceae bacterium]
MRKIYLLIGVSIVLILVGISPSCNESTINPDLYGNIKGTVFGPDGKTPLEGVSITTSPGSSAVITNAEGIFDLGVVKTGDYAISAKKDGYSASTTNVTLGEGDVLQVDIVMIIPDDENVAPNAAVYSTPENKSSDQLIQVDLLWQGSDPNEKDSILHYDVLLYEGEAQEELKVVDNSLDTTFTLSGLKYGTTYRWKVVTRDEDDLETTGEVWSFRTQDYPDNRYFFVKDTLGSAHIFSTDLTALNTIQVTNNTNRQTQPRISPNGQKVAYISNETGEYHIYTMNKDGSEKFQVTLGHPPIAGYHNNGIGYSWSPDGAFLIYSHNSKLFRVNNDGTNHTLIATAPVNRHFKELNWNGNNDDNELKIVALTTGEQQNENEIYLIHPDPTVGTQLLLVDDLSGTISSPCFSENGLKVFFSRDVDPVDADNGRQFDTRIFSVDLDGSNITDLSENKTAGTNDFQARPSRDGSKIIFMNTSADGISQRDIWVMDIDGSDRELIISNGEMPDWR